MNFGLRSICCMHCGRRNGGINNGLRLVYCRLRSRNCGCTCSSSNSVGGLGAQVARFGCKSGGSSSGFVCSTHCQTF